MALLGMAEYASGDLPAAEQSLLAFQATTRQRGDLSSALGITFILANIWLAQGRLREAISAYRQVLQLATQQAALPIGTSDLYRGLSELLIEQGDFDQAAQHLATAQQVGEQAALTGWLHRLGVAQARLTAVQGDPSGALALLDEAERQYVRNPLPDQPIAAMKARLWIRQGRLGEAERWARAQGLSPDDDLHYLREFDHLTLARLLIARYRSERDERSIRDAVQLLDRLLSAAEDGGRTGSVIEVVMLQALAQYAQGDPSAAIASLERALSLAEPEGYVQLFVAEGSSVTELLTRMNASHAGGSREPYVRHLLTALGARQDDHPSSLILHPLVEPLSERELDVLKLLGTELSGPEIADKLHVSLNTVRTHTKNIYSKLGVSNRRAAIRRAEELGLL
jgi:LuxR family maltose regulon positive regulatory protein